MNTSCNDAVNNNSNCFYQGAAFYIQIPIMVFRICLLLFLLTLCFHSKAQPGWQLNKNSNGIKVYTKTADSSSFKSIKVEGIFAGTWERLYTILTDVDNHKQWVYNTKKSNLLKRISHLEVLYYIETSLPWPVENRDIPIRMIIDHNTLNNTYKVTTAGEPDAIPAKKGLVRVPYFNATWEVKPLENRQLAITYYLDVRPGGGIPAWVVNLFTIKGPYDTFSKLAVLLKK